MSAPNFLGLRCPKCGNEASINILAELWVRVTADGTDPEASGENGYEYSSDSIATCTACAYVAIAEEFESH